jgi:hypothetical protein
MPPRYAYWTILIDDRPTAFRAHDQADLLPTLHQLRRTNQNVVLKWFARGRVWNSREEEQAARQKPRDARRAHGAPAGEKRDAGWRPGGSHRDPRERFQKRRGGRTDGRRARATGPRKGRP